MFSINIPVFNVDVVKLVDELAEQGKKLEVPFEIRVYDDGSDENTRKTNRKLRGVSHVVYFEQEKNIGRAAIRNKMGFESEYELLLFIDADSELVQKNYLKNYLENHSQGSIVCGGTSYQPEKPSNAKKLLRWVYGTKREAVSADVRNRKKGFVITSNNFLIEKAIFLEIHFREELRNYGHEDTLLGYDLFRAGKTIRHINNPVMHTGLEDSLLFTEKTGIALNNLRYVSAVILQNNPDFIHQVYFLDVYYRVTKIIPPLFLRWCFRWFKRAIEKNLQGENPSLFLFDVYKLCFYSTLK